MGEFTLQTHGCKMTDKGPKTLIYYSFIFNFLSTVAQSVLKDCFSGGGA